MASGKAIGEGPDRPKRRRKRSETAKLKEAMVRGFTAIDEKFRVIWNELRELRYGKQIDDDAEELEKRLKIR